jgi:hypothetical protein
MALLLHVLQNKTEGHIIMWHSFPKLDKPRSSFDDGTFDHTLEILSDTAHLEVHCRILKLPSCQSLDDAGTDSNETQVLKTRIAKLHSLLLGLRFTLSVLMVGILVFTPLLRTSEFIVV